MFPARTGEESRSLLHEGPCACDGVMKCLQGLSGKVSSPLRFPSDSGGKKSCQASLAWESIWEQLIKIDCIIAETGKPTCAIWVKPSYSLIPSAFAGGHISEGLMALWRGEPGTEPEGGDKSPFFKPFLYPNVKKKNPNPNSPKMTKATSNLLPEKFKHAGKIK